MSRKTLVITALAIAVSLVTLVSFRSASVESRKITILKHYSSSDAEFNNAIIICSPDGKTKKLQLLQHKKDNFEMNDKMLTQQLNELVATGLQIVSIESYGERSFFVTTYVLQ